MMRELRRMQRAEKPGLHYAFPALVLLAVVACAPESYEGDPLTDPASDLEMPEIVPLQPLLGQIGDAPDADDPDPELRQRGEALREQLTGVDGGVAAGGQNASAAQADADFEARGNDLRQRAEEVRNAQQ